MSSKRFSLLNQVEKADPDNNVSVEGNVSINRISSTFSPLSIHGVNDKNPLMDSMNVDDDEDTEDKRVLKMLNLINTDENENNLTSLNSFGGIRGIVKALDVDIINGLNELQVDDKRKKFGTNSFAVAPLVPYYTLVLETMNDASLLILLLAATFSLIVGIYRHGFHHGWIEGSAIFIAVFVVANITAMNNYTKQLQFKKIEEIATNDFTCNVIRNGIYFNINPKDLVVGDIVSLQVGDAIPADCILLDGSTCKSNESTLTGEADDVSKGKSNPFLLSSCTVTAGNTSGNIKAMVIAVGARSKWGKIKDGITNGITTDALTPLQLKLQELTKLIGNIGMFFSVATFIAYVLNHADLIPMRSENGVAIIEHVIDGFILAVTILVVAIPEGLPLAVTISLAWSTQKMYKDKCFIRVLASCEVMGNATNICSDKTGTLTENKMTVVEGYFGDKMYTNLNESNAFSPISKHHISILDIATKTRVIENMAVNRTAYYIRGKNKKLIGSKTEGALIDLINRWGFDEEDIKKQVFSEERGDKLFPFCSEKKLSSCLLQYTSTHQRTYIKGASEWILKKCTHFTNDFGIPTEITPSKRAAIERFITNMANASLRTIALAYNDTKMLTYAGADEVDIESYVLDAVIGIIDPLREGVIESVKTAQEAGICVTGDNIHTAMAIAKQAGILHDDGIALEGSSFRKLTCAELDNILPKLQVLARASPYDKFLLVTRLNGTAIPKSKREWVKQHQEEINNDGRITFESHKDILLPGYIDEWSASFVRPSTRQGEIVGVTGDGTNDSMALKCADVGLAMGSGTACAAAASDIVILDDAFGSIVKSILWGRSVYDNIRKFLQFQLTVNIVALLLVFTAACAGTPSSPLSSTQMLWVNLIMDSLGALALATEAPTSSLLKRKPYRRNAPLVSYPMWRNIIVQAMFQLTLLYLLLFYGQSIFGINTQNKCMRYSAVDADWSYIGFSQDGNSEIVANCESILSYCPSLDSACLNGTYEVPVFNSTSYAPIQLNNIPNIASHCAGECYAVDYTHNTIIFNTFVFCQIFNEINSRKLFNELNSFSGILNNHVFMLVLFFTILFQWIIVQYSGAFMKVSPLTLQQWLACIVLGSLSLIINVFSRLIMPINEPATSFNYVLTSKKPFYSRKIHNEF